MRKTMFKRISSGLLSLLMLSSLAASPVLAADSRPEPAAVSTRAAISDFEIQPLGVVTPDSTQITLHIQCADPEISVVNVFLLPVTASGYDEDDPIAQKMNAAIGDVTLDISAGKLTAGSQFCVKLTYTKNDDVRETFSGYFTVENHVTSSKKTPEEILKNTTATLMKDGKVRTETFRQSETSVDVKVQLDDSLSQCYMTLYAYSANTAFDPDSSYNKRLWTGYVQNGQVTCTFQNQLPLHYNVIACLNVPVGEDFYRPSNSQALEVVDDSGEGFQDYTYPDASIVETKLEPGATKLHVRLTGDERLFQAVKEDKTSITVAVAQYPNDGTTFDFEGERQISLASNLSFKAPQDRYEVTLSEPLKAGWRVRAVVYWQQNESIFLPKGNDYEAIFQRPDDSVLVSGTAEEEIPAVSIQGAPKAGDTSVLVKLGGKLPAGTRVLLKRYPAGTEDADCLLGKGTYLTGAEVSAEGEQNLTVSNLIAGEKLAAFLTGSSGQLANSKPVTVAAAQTTPLFTVKPKGALTASSTQITFSVTSSDSSITTVGAFLCPVKNGSVDSDNWIVCKLGQNLGEITLDIPEGKLKDGDVVRLVLNYEKGDDYSYYFGTEANNITVGTQTPVEDSVLLNESTFTTAATQATVTVTGCESFRDGYLILTTGRASTNGDADSRDRLGSVIFTGPGTYTVSFSKIPGKLLSGNTIQAYLYKYDSVTEKVEYRYSNAVSIASGIQPPVKSEVSIATDSITADRTDVWVRASFDGALTGTLKLYTYTGEIFKEDQAEEIYSGKIASSTGSQKITFGSGKLTAGQKLLAVLSLSDGTSVSSPAKTVQAAPEKIQPSVRFVTTKVTAGMTKLYAALTFDRSVNDARYTIYQFSGDVLDVSTATALSSGRLYRSQMKETVPLGRGKLVPGAKLQIVLTADGIEARSNILTVEPSPDWGMPYAAFNVAAVKTDEKSVCVHIDYADEYIAMGNEFYCDVTIYQFPGSYSDAEFESRELWENPTVTQRVGQINSNYGDETRGAEVTVPLLESAVLNAGDRLIIKLRLPHTEWEGEEADYLSASVPVVGEYETVPDAKVVLYNLGEDTSRGARVRAILSDLNIPVETVATEQLNETVGHLAGLDGYEAAEETYTGTVPDTEFMLMCNLPEALLDRFLDAMQADGLRIDHKAVVTAYNRDRKLHELIGDILAEHDVFQALLELDRLIAQAEKLEEDIYGSSANWTAFQTALGNARQILSSEDPTLMQLHTAQDALKNEYLMLTGRKEMRGDVVILLTQVADGTYTLRAELKDGIPDTVYQYMWSNGVQTAGMTGVTEEQLHTLQVTVSADTLLGSRTAQLQVPHLPAATAAATSDSITLHWKAPTDEENRPAAKTVAVRLFQGDQLLREQLAHASDGSMTLTGLSANTSYTLRIMAISPVGRSDMQILDMSTVKVPSGGNSSSGSSRGGSYAVSAASTKNGYVSVTPKNARKGDTMTITVKPDHGYELGSISVKDASGNSIELTAKGDGRYIFTMPASKVEIKATFAERVEKPAYSDVSAKAWYAKAVAYVTDKDMMEGDNGRFMPLDKLTRSQMAQVLFSLEGKKRVNDALSFHDVKGSEWYAEAVRWTASERIMNGYENGNFGPNDPLTREQLAVILHCYAAHKGYDVTASSDLTAYHDGAATSSWAKSALEWAVGDGLLSGKDGNRLDSQGTATRAEVAMILMRFCENVAK